jgi:dockerin type I repeat protein
MIHIRQLFLMRVGAVVVFVAGAGNTGVMYGEVREPAPRSATADGETIVVTTLEDDVDFPQPQTVTQLPGPDGRISFREAVVAANNTTGPQTITFAIPQNQWWLLTNVALLKLENSIFSITGDETTVDFSTQTAFTGDTNPDGKEVGIYGLEPNGAGSPAIVVNGNNCVIRGLGAVYQRGYGVQLRGNNNRVVGSNISGPFYAAVYISGGFGSPPASGNIVGGTAAGDGNILSAGNSGVRIDGPAANNLVVGNTQLSGAFYGAEVRSAPSSNLFATNNRIGGATAAERNLISGSGHFGEEGFPVGGQVSLQEAVGTIVQGNLIGTNAAGTASFGQKGPAGVEARNATGTQILDNVISGILVVGIDHFAGQRFGIGISLKGNNDGSIVRGNLIGTDVSGQNAVANRAGIVTSFWPGSSGSGAVIIGGINEDQGNTIAFNETIGVAVDSTSRGIRISGNSIDSNGGLGIDLYSESGAGVTPNDSGDADDGGNGLQNFPVLQSAVVSAGGTVVSGNLNSLPNSQFSLEFFASPQCDPSGFGEGRSFLGAAIVTTDSSGNAPFQVSVAPAPGGSFITATATQLSTGNTSEFSACQLATASSGPALQLQSAVSRKPHGTMGSFDIDLPLSGAPAVECRNSGGNHTLIFTFNNNVVNGSTRIDKGIATISGTGFSGKTMTISLTGVADAQMVTLVLAGVTDEFSQVLPEKSVSVRMLMGDTNGNGVVNSSDVSQAKAQSGQFVLNTTFRTDANANGAINAADVGLIKSKVGNAAP